MEPSLNNVLAASKIEGWMSGDELLWLAEQASKHKLIVEIGCYKGRSTRALADNTRGIVLTFDNFGGPTEIEVPNREEIYNEYQRNTFDCNNIITFRENHREIFYTGPDADMIFIDGAHGYHAVLSDIRYWIDHLQPNGLICGHDYGSDWPGVDKAVREIFGEPERGPGSIWFRQCV